ncbi:HdeD family acid-resistance protein [Methylocystis sp. JAN1]|uniref:HdeD family acid-resistance protein n=1 Tax=Methylocystis sp. JAN1 TaxID=3397211 RepID=UPI003FA26203
MTKPFDIFVAEAPDVLAVHWGWALALGIAIGAIGLLAIIRARAATQIAVVFFGILLTTSALAVLIFDFSVAGLWSGFFVHVLWAVLVGIVGVMLFMRPLAGAQAITLVLAFYFLVSGLATIGFALSSHLDNLWIYLLQGAVSLLLGALLLIGWPFTGNWVIGTFIGVDLLFKGLSIVALGLALRSISEGPLL